MKDDVNTVVITFAHLSWQKGSVAQVVSFVREWRRANGPTRFVLVSQFPELDRPAAAELDVEIAGHRCGRGCSPNLQNLRWLASLWLAVLARRLGWEGAAPSLFRRNSVICAFHRADLVADLSGDSYRDRPGGFAPAHNALLLGVRLLGIPLAIISQSLGPFRWYNRGITARALNSADSIYLRERSTLAQLEMMGVAGERCLLAPDVAFALPLPPTEHLDWIWRRATAGATEKIWIGISMNCLMLDFTENSRIYIDQMTRLARHIHSTCGAGVLLVPHVFHSSALGMDDVVPCRELAHALGHPAWLRYLEDDHSPMELKGIISRCEALVAARMHAGIAGLSSGVPTMLLSWSHKYRALLAEIGLERFTWESSDGSVDELLATFDELWSCRARIRTQLEEYRDDAVVSIARVLGQVMARAGLSSDAGPRALQSTASAK